jgi:hypothetical protein
MVSLGPMGDALTVSGVEIAGDKCWERENGSMGGAVLRLMVQVVWIGPSPVLGKRTVDGLTGTALIGIVGCRGNSAK